ncbi:MAG: oligosaccharide flippase family protein [Peptococcaceae bacterium]|nr:oligosaccharide flippase family protein [Peptococcaceae bacterium]
METKKLAKHGLVYTATSLAAQAISLLMVPIFTRNMTQAQYGQYNLLISVQSFLAIFITLGIFSGMSRFINEFVDKNRTKNIVLTFSLLWGSLMCLFAAAGAGFIYHLILSNQQDGGYYINFIVISSVLLCFISIYTSYFTMLFKPKHVTITNLARVIFMLAYSAYLIMVKKEGLYGALQAQLLAFSSVVIGLIWYDFKNIRLVLAWPELKAMLLYGLGLVPGQAAGWVYTLIDRYFIQIMLGLQQVAVYSIGYRLGMMMDPVFLSPFKSVFTSFKYKVYKDADATRKIKEIYVIYNFVGWFCILGFSVFAKPAIAILATSAYSDAFTIVPIVVFSYFLSGLGEFYSLGIHIQNKSIVESYILAVGAAINVVLNVVLIPRLGIMGAAYATVLSYLAMNVLYYFIGKKYLELDLHYFAPFKGSIVFLILYGFYFIVHGSVNNIYLNILLATGLCLIYPFLGIAVGIIPREMAKAGVLVLMQKAGRVRFKAKI